MSCDALTDLLHLSSSAMMANGALEEFHRERAAL